MSKCIAEENALFIYWCLSEIGCLHFLGFNIYMLLIQLLGIKVISNICVNERCSQKFKRFKAVHFIPAFDRQEKVTSSTHQRQEGTFTSFTFMSIWQVMWMWLRYYEWGGNSPCSIHWKIKGEGEYEIRQASNSHGVPLPPKYKIKHLAAYYSLLSVEFTTEFLSYRCKRINRN